MSYLGIREIVHTTRVYKFEFTYSELVILAASLRKRQDSCDGNAGELTTTLIAQVQNAQAER